MTALPLSIIVAESMKKYKQLKTTKGFIQLNLVVEVKGIEKTRLNAPETNTIEQCKMLMFHEFQVKLQSKSLTKQYMD